MQIPLIQGLPRHSLMFFSQCLPIVRKHELLKLNQLHSIASFLFYSIGILFEIAN
jgi:hypothetical protein